MAEGDIGAVIDSLEFIDADITHPDIIHISGDVYAIVYSDVNSDGFVCTVEILADGQVGAAVIDSLEFDADNCNYADMVHVVGDVYAIAYQGPANDGYITTVSIAADGEIGAAVIDSSVFEATYGSTPKIIGVSAAMYAITCTNSSYQGVVHTIGIDVTGNIDATVTDSLVFSVGNGLDPDIVHISDDVYAIAYRNTDDDGVICTVEINVAGVIGAAVMDSLEFDITDCFWPRPIYVSGDVYAIAYRGVGSDGFVCTVEILADGQIGAAVIDSLEFDAGTGDQPSLIHVSGDVCAIAYMGVGQDGFVLTLGISTIAPSRVQHLLEMGIG